MTQLYYLSAAITSAIADAAALLDCYRHWRNKVSS